jgi:hypothetical protein
MSKTANFGKKTQGILGAKRLYYLDGVYWLYPMMDIGYL